MKSTLGWAEIDRARKREIIEAIASGEATRGPLHLELDLTDRCNVACYFCNQMDVRTTQQLPYERITGLIDELAEQGLKAVRLSGGGDPLVHRQIVPVLDHLAQCGVVVDNLTTNGALLSPEIIERLVEHRAREVIISLNAVDAGDYFRMMRVPPKTFERVLANTRQLVAARGESSLPGVVVQFLIDRHNYTELPRMLQLGRSLGADRVTVGPVLSIPNQRIDPEDLLRPGDHLRLRPLLRQALEADVDDRLLDLTFPWPHWNKMVAVLRAEVGAEHRELYPQAPSYDETDNGWCFFAWFSSVVRGNGDLHPCCMLMNPEYEPLGNLLEDGGRFADHWHGPAFERMREEMRDLFLTKGRIVERPGRFKILKEACTQPYRCAHKNRFFRDDGEFFQELSAALEEAREREVRRSGGGRPAERAAEVAEYERQQRRQRGEMGLWERLRRAWRTAASMLVP